MTDLDVKELIDSFLDLKVDDIPNLTSETSTNWKLPEKTEDVLKKEVTEKFLLPPSSLSWSLLDQLQEIPSLDKSQFLDQLIAIPKPLECNSLKFDRIGLDGDIDGYEEVNDYSSFTNNLDSSNSWSLNRQVGPRVDLVKGRSGFLPFKPGGLELSDRSDKFLLHRDENGLFDIPPGLSRGMNINIKINDSIEGVEELDQQDDKEDDEDEEEEEESPPPIEEIPVIGSKFSTKAIPKKYEYNIDDILPVDIAFGRPNSSGVKTTGNVGEVIKTQKRDWAHVVDLNHKLENFNELVPNMARTWPFELDTFQQEAVYHLEQGDSVFVAAHTSAGKTVVAEYAIAMASRNMTKAIYTSPIKALSNQKFRDFKQDFKEVDVGLITGDVQINPEANCLIMTTEILRSMLYRGADLIRDVEFVIFDEVHYVNDIDRGVVWEEVIIMLPDHVKFILLSATVPNTFEFANWVGRTKHKDIYVISTPKRPVPLEYFIWAKKDIFKFVDQNRNFLDDGYKKHKNILEPPVKPEDKENAANRGRGGGRGGRGGRGDLRGGRGGVRGGARGGARGRGGGSAAGKRMGRDGPNKNTWLHLVQYMNKNELLPAVIFVFSKKRCEEYANTIKSVDFCNAKEKAQIHMFIDKAVTRLKKEDRTLPQIMSVRDMLSRGIAIHHGGLLPIVKEVIEILFSKTLIKVLFATETFAMGLNLPTRTVVFSEIRKHDGRGFRDLLPGEFTQMAGRAGRRGLDDVGTVIIMSFNQPLQEQNLKSVTLGTPTKLQSQFRLTYNMILNLLRIEALRVEEMIKRSFSENSSQILLPEHEDNVKLNEDLLKNVNRDSCPNCDDDLEMVHDNMIEIEEMNKMFVAEAVTSPIGRRLFPKGRLIIFRGKNGNKDYGFILRTNHQRKSFYVLAGNERPKKKSKSKKNKPEPKENDIPFIPEVFKRNKKIIPHFKTAGKFYPELVPFTDILFVTNFKTYTNVDKIFDNDPDAIQEASNLLTSFIKRIDSFKEVNWSTMKLVSFVDILARKELLTQQILGSKSISCDNFVEHFSQVHERYKIKKNIENLKGLISDQNLELLPDYEQRLEVLKDLGFIDNKLNVLLKGRVACEINSGWELAITELVLDNFLGDFEPEEIVALLSAFVYEGRTNDEEATVTPRLDKAQKKIKDIIGGLLNVYQEHQIPLTSDEAEFLDRKRFALVNTVYEWARGRTFKEIMEISPEPEGTIVRVITRLDEICREVKTAALIIGDSALHSKMSEAQEKIKRDIVFCASLYL